MEKFKINDLDIEVNVAVIKKFLDKIEFPMQRSSSGFISSSLMICWNESNFLCLIRLLTIITFLKSFTIPSANAFASWDVRAPAVTR